jgi:hypothetical protein
MPDRTTTLGVTHMRRTRRTAVVTTLLVTLGVPLAACSLSDEESAVAQGLARPLAGVDLVLTQDDATCVAETWVGEVGAEPFVEEGLANARHRVRRGAVRQVLAGRRPVSQALAEGYADGILNCVDFDELSLQHKDRPYQPSEEQMDEYADCLRELGTDVWHDGLAAGLMGRDSSRLDRARRDCARELR